MYTRKHAEGVWKHGHSNDAYHVVGGAGVSIADLWENRKTTTLRLPNDLVLYVGPFTCTVRASVKEEKKRLVSTVFRMCQFKTS